MDTNRARQENPTIIEPSLPDSTAALRLMRLTWWVLVICVGAASLYINLIQYQPDLVEAFYLLVMPAGYFILAFVLFLRRPNDPLAIVTSLMLIFVGPYLIGGVGTTLEALPGWFFPANTLSILGILLTLIFIYTFPNGRFVPSWGRWVIASVGVLAVAAMLLNQRTTDVIVITFLISVAFGLGCQVYRYRRISTLLEKQQAKWVAFGLLGVLATIAWWFLVLVPRGYLTPNLMVDADILTMLGSTIMPLVLPLGITISMLRYRLWDVDLIIRRTLVYAILTGLLAGIYFASVILIQLSLSLLGGSRESPLITVLTTLMIVALFSPLRRRVQTLIDRRFYRRKYNAEQALATFAAAVRSEVQVEHLSDELLHVVNETVQPERIYLWLRDIQLGQEHNSREN